MATPTHPLVFLSHSGVDGPLVSAVMGLLIAGAGLDPSEIYCTKYEGLGEEPGAELLPEVCNALLSAHNVVMLITPGFLESPWCRHESSISGGNGQRVTPILVPPADRSVVERELVGLRGKRFVGVRDSASWQQLLSKIQSTTTRPPVPGFRTTVVNEFIEVHLPAALKRHGQLEVKPRPKIIDRTVAKGLLLEEAKVEVASELDVAGLVKKLSNCRKGLRIWTTWTPLLASRSCEPRKEICGAFEDVVDALEAVARRPRQPIHLEIVLIRPDTPDARRRSQELDVRLFSDMAAENYKNARSLLRFQENCTSVRISARYTPYLPPFSYYQVDDYIDMGFFQRHIDASHGHRFVFSGATHAGKLIAELFKRTWQDPERAEPIERLDDNFAGGK